MGVIRVVSMAELHLSDAGQIEANWQSLSNEQLVSLAPSGRSLEQLKRELADGSRVILSDTPILPLFRYQSGEWITNIQEGISPHAVNQIQKRFASAGSSAHFKTSTGSLAPAIEPVYSPDPSLTQIAPTTAPTAKISPKFAQARRRLELELVYDDKEETAAGKVPYRVEFSDGSQKSGVLNAKGWACLEDCPNGEATVIFGDEAERQSAEQRLPDLYRQLAASLDTAAAEMAKKSEQLAAQADVQQISDSFRQKVDAQLAELTAQREQFNQQQIWQQALQTGQAYTQGLSQGTASFMDDLLDFSGLMAFLEEAEISLSLLLEAIMTGDVDALESKLAQWRARGENGLKATGEAMEMLILLLKDEYVRALLQSLPLRYLDALPKDKLAEITGYIHSRVSLDGMLEMSLVLLAALVGSVFGVILMFLVVTKKRASRIISPASSVLEDIAKAQKAVRNDHAVQTYIGKHQTPLNSKTPKGDVDTPQKSRKNADKDVPNRQVLTKAERLNIQKALQTRVEDIRAELPKKLQGSGNVGVAQLDIPGLPIELKAHSRINYPTDKGADGFVHLADESDWIFKPKAVDPDNVRVGTPDAYTRQWDTEFKILNDVALRLGNNRNATGSINLFTERLTCTSCTDVIFDFKARYPNIQLNVFAGE
ncbi:deaminase domain-containing protein [Shewanella algae]|uniref:deaminase domain-containing protein n=1 Tax=Shewanella algae TaxID=38313 RepID=UPI0031F5A78F